MSRDTAISWADSSLNLEMGCAGCELWNPKNGTLDCYAGNLVNRYGGLDKDGVKRKGYPLSFDQPEIYPERLPEALKWKDLTGTDRPKKPWLNGLPRLIFLNDMGDTFTPGLPLDWLAAFMPDIAASPHQYLILTKQAKRMVEYSQSHPFPPNVWPGVSVTTQRTLPRIDSLAQVKGGGPRFVSIGPLWQRLTFSPEQLKTFIWCIIEVASDGDNVGDLSRDGSIQNEAEWNSAAEEVVDQCDSHGVRVFTKQIPLNGKLLFDVDQYPAKLRRRDYP